LGYGSVSPYRVPHLYHNGCRLMLFLIGHATTPDKLKLITSAAGDIDTSVSYSDVNQATLPAAAVEDLEREDHTITTAATTDICAGITTATKRRIIKQVSIVNTHASVSNNVSVILDAIDGNDYQITETVTLAPGEALKYDEGVGWFPAKNPLAVIGGATNKLLGANQSGLAADTYMSNSALTLAALGPPTIGRCYHWRFIVSKTAAGTATPIIQVRVGTAGTTGDTSRLTFTWGAGTAAVDRAEIELDAMFIAVGASAILRGKANMTSNLQTTGLSNGVKALQPADSATFDSTVAASIIGLSYNGGTSAVHDIEYMAGYTDDF
jgi:hypothetical protein